MFYLRTCVAFCLLNLILEVTDGLAVPRSSPNACIIGAGYSGLASARYLQQYGVLNITVYEASRYIGGTWRFDPHVGTDEDGIPLFTSMYKDLRTNTPRQTMEFGGYSFPEGTPSYPSGPCFYKYLKNFAKEFDLNKYVHLRSYVTSVRWADDHWNVTYMRTDSRENQTDACDFIIIATGQYSALKFPKFPGQEDFKGNLIHSHDYKDSSPYKNRRVLLLGAGPSGLDLALHLVNVTTKLVHSHHLVYNQPNYPKHYIKKPDIRSFSTNGVEFIDGSFEEVDDVIFCTGYDYSLPFLDQSSGLTVSNKFVLPLYQHSVNIRHPSMIFIGIAKRIINRVLDAQAEYAAALISGKFKLPSQEDMLKIWLDHVYSLQTKGMRIVDVNAVGPAMDEFFGNLTKEAGIARVPPVLSDIRDFNAQNRLDDWFNYRNYDYIVKDDYHYVREFHPRKDSPCPINVD